MCRGCSSARIRERDPYPPWQAPVVISWAGIRGAVSLAAALALPTDLPGRDLIVFLTFAVILVTLVGQGLTLPLLIRLLHVEDDGAPSARTRRRASRPPRPRSRGSRSSRRKTGCARTRPNARAAQYRFRANRFRARYRRRRRGGRRGAFAAVPAAAARAARGRAPGGARAAQRRDDHRGGDAARAARHRPRGLSASTFS